MEAITLKQIHEDLEFLKNDIKLIKHIISEEYGLSNWTRNELKLARATPRKEYISQEEMEKEFL